MDMKEYHLPFSINIPRHTCGPSTLGEESVSQKMSPDGANNIQVSLSQCKMEF